MPPKILPSSGRSLSTFSKKILARKVSAPNDSRPLGTGISFYNSSKFKCVDPDNIINALCLSSYHKLCLLLGVYFFEFLHE
jgi:hypothetical protein